MATYKTPGVYIVEKSAFPNSVVAVATAVPAFVGYTETADNKGKPLRNVPWRITSMAEFQNYFGSAPAPLFSFAETSSPASLSFADKHYALERVRGKYLLYYSMQLFFQNGGGACYIVSVGGYGDAVDAAQLRGGIDLLVKEQEPTLLVIPDAVLLAQSDCIAVQQHALDHCGNVTKSRMAILDIFDGYRGGHDVAGDPVAAFRDAIGDQFLDYAAAYYPWLHTTINRAKDQAYWNLDSAGLTLLQTLLQAERKTSNLPADKTVQLQNAIDGIVQTEAAPQDKTTWHNTLLALSPLYTALLTEMADQLNLLPPSAAMAGIYTMVDNNRGVWKAPANVSLNAVVAPAVNLSLDDQESLNVPPDGKAVNAIRTFVGEGVLVWGARTLDGNNQDWRYINVRRTAIMIEQSIKLAANAFVFEPNVAATWVAVQNMISNFLTGIWQQGGLAGSTPKDAFAVQIGLGTTMTADDILEGIMRVTVLVALIRPAEFIEITFEQQMQQS
ncbi:MAG: phage tail sheath C-terminal domain-containing protein [Sideroxydans sp.]|nr:phage tail sheath C-terminal domain-containing protein [Sideroxydans sp.]